MERETSDFDDWLRTVEAATEDIGLVDFLGKLATLTSKNFGVNLWFVEIHGPRWSYIAGEMPEQPPPTGVERTELGENIGLVSDSWEKLSEDDWMKLVEFLKRLISQRLRRGQSTP